VTGSPGDELQQGSERPSPAVPRWVTATLPRGGLRLTRQSIGVAACGEVQTTDGSRVLTAGRSLAVRFSFALTKECPTALPVQARVTVSLVRGSRQISGAISVLDDLSGIDFDQC
jgi:hypothetical protein